MLCWLQVCWKIPVLDKNERGAWILQPLEGHRLLNSDEVQQMSVATAVFQVFQVLELSFFSSCLLRANGNLEFVAKTDSASLLSAAQT